MYTDYLVGEVVTGRIYSNQLYAAITWCTVDRVVGRYNNSFSGVEVMHAYGTFCIFRIIENHAYGSSRSSIKHEQVRSMITGIIFIIIHSSCHGVFIQARLLYGAVVFQVIAIIYLTDLFRHLGLYLRSDKAQGTEQTERTEYAFPSGAISNGRSRC
ncbi:hypothetical protein D9M68_639760 [compost metagenome]